MDDFKARLDAAIKQATDDYQKDVQLQKLAKSIRDAMTDYDDKLKDIFLNLPLSKRERKRIAKSERQEALKARKRK